MTYRIRHRNSHMLMGYSERGRGSPASQAHKIVDEVMQIARSELARASASGGSKPHVTITKNVTDYSDTYFRSMLSGIEFATRGHFDHGRESPGYTEWILRGRLVDVTVRASKGMG